MVFLPGWYAWNFLSEGYHGAENPKPPEWMEMIRKELEEAK